MFAFAVSSSHGSKPGKVPYVSFRHSSNHVHCRQGDKVVLTEAIVSCKAEAKGNWLARRKYVNHCVAEALKDRPNIDVIQLLKNHPGLIDLPMEQWDAF